MRARESLVCLVWAVCALALPAGASAKPGYFASEPFRYAEAHVRGSHGYRLRIDAFSSNVDVTATKGNSSVHYVARRGRLREDRIRARLPGVGWVFLRFHETNRHHEDPAAICKGEGSLTRRGFFTGSVRIHGERGYTRVESHRVRGKILREGREVCRSRPTARASSSAEETLFANVERGDGVLSFYADKWPPERGGFNALFFNGTLTRLRGTLVIANSNYGFTEDTSTFAVAKPPRSATIDPPAPLSGSATFTQEGPDTFSWLGDLEVELPGIGPVALAGPNFSATLCIGKQCKGNADESARFFSRQPIP